jgi:hypothetical protein
MADHLLWAALAPILRLSQWCKGSESSANSRSKTYQPGVLNAASVAERPWMCNEVELAGDLFTPTCENTARLPNAQGMVLLGA